MNVFITGANRGFGLSLASFFLKKGHFVVASIRGSVSDELRKLDGKYNGMLAIVQMDAGNLLSVSEACRVIKQITPVIDIIINNAASEGLKNKKIEDIIFEDFETTLRINLMGPMAVVQEIAPHMDRSLHKIIINVSSEAGSLADIPLKYYGYSISKAALNMFGRLLARDLKPRGFKVLSVHPGWMKTDMGGSDAPLEPDAAAERLYMLIESLNKDDFEDNFIDNLGMNMRY